MPHLCSLNFAGITVTLRTEQTVEAEESFRPFLTERVDADIEADFACVEQLLPVPGEKIARSMGSTIYADGQGGFLRFFWVDPSAREPYAAAMRSLDGRHIRVEYLESGRKHLSQLGNSFYHMDLEDMLIRFHRLCFHAACVETPLGGILFTGPSGIGKSTQAELWCRYRDARQINGDRPILSRDADRWLAWGSPYAGSSRVYVNESCPVTAIVSLRQAKSCSLRRLGAGEAFRAVWSGLAVHSWDPGFMETASSLALDLAAAVPVYQFACTPDEEAVAFLERELRKEIAL